MRMAAMHAAPQTTSREMWFSFRGCQDGAVAAKYIEARWIS